MPSFRARLHVSVVGSISFSLVLSTMPTPAAADPTDGKVVAGAATITERVPGTVVVTQTTQRAIIDWRSFNIGENETTRFDQPNASAIALNRITGDAPTVIQGSLLANGQVWLINPNGIAFGRNARVDVAGLIATTLDIDNRDFMAGRYTFTGPADGQGTVTNAGHITIKDAGLAALVAPGVENSGIIEAHYGRVTLGSAAGFTVDFYGDGLTRFLASGRVAGALEGIGNDRGRVAITTNAAKSIVDSSINLGGVSEATGLNVSGGSITLTGPATGYVSVSGTVDTSGPQGAGGRIDVTAKDVRLASTAALNASGSNQGGIVRIGGDWHGQGDLPTASTTTVENGALVRVGAAQGYAGSAVVWSDDQTRFAGSIVATGDTSGGSVEVSGERLLDYTGTTDLRSVSGRVGTLLLDPRNVTIAAAGSTATLPVSGATTLTPTDDDSILSVATLQGALALGNVTVTTGATGAQAGDIKINGSIVWSSSSALSLEAFRNLSVASGMTIANSGAGNLTLRADSTGTGSGTVSFADSTSRIDYRSSTGTVSILYNPIGGYTASTDYSANVLTSTSVSNQTFYGMLVNTAADLQNVTTNLNASYALGKDIDASVTSTWNGGSGFVPIGTDAVPFFTGNLNGEGHAIANLYIKAPGQDVGLFRIVGEGGRIDNLNLTGASVTALAPSSATFVGILAGENRGSISEVSTGGVVAGGIPTNVTPSGWSPNLVGGLVGANDGSNSPATIMHSRSSASVNGGMYNIAGGLVGINLSSFAANGPAATIVQSYATGDVTGYSVGGLVGFNNSGPNSAGGVFSSYATGNVIGVISQGYSIAGGLIGQNNGSVSQSYSAGKVKTGLYIGGLIGSVNLDSKIENSYYDFTVNAILPPFWNAADIYDYTQLTTTALKGGLPPGFDSAIWNINPTKNNGYPHLKWEDVGLPSSVSTAVSFGTGAAPPAPPPSTPAIPPRTSTPPTQLQRIPPVTKPIAQPGAGLNITNFYGTPPNSGVNYSSANYGSPIASLIFDMNGFPLVLDSYSNGQYEGTGQGKYQCVELIQRYLVTLGVSSGSAQGLGNGNLTAQNVAANYPRYFSWVAESTAAALPKIGAVISFSDHDIGGKASSALPDGHVAIVQDVRKIDNNTYSVVLFDQNFPLYTGAFKTVTFHFDGQNWSGVLTNTSKTFGTEQVPVVGWANPR